MTRLGDVFPADEVDSPWLFRLAVLRDDLDYELRHLAMDKDAQPLQLWDAGYFLRRIAVTLSEVKDVWNQHVAHAKKHWPLETEARRILSDFEKSILAAAQKLQAVRNALGGHVRLSNAKPKGTDGVAFERALLEQFADWKGPAQIHFPSGFETTFRGLTLTAVFQATGTDTPEKLVDWHEELELLQACGDAMHAVDFLIYLKLTIRLEQLGSSANPSAGESA